MTADLCYAIVSSFYMSHLPVIPLSIWITTLCLHLRKDIPWIRGISFEIDIRLRYDFFTLGVCWKEVLVGKGARADTHGGKEDLVSEKKEGAYMLLNKSTYLEEL